MTHHLIRRLRRVFGLLPPYELGLGALQLSRLECRHPALRGRRAVQLSDLHIDRYLTRHEQATERISGLAPDWIFITGDLLDTPAGLPHLGRFLAELGRIAPVFVTLGNHDHASGVPVTQFAALADRHGARLLMNRSWSVPLDSGELIIVGLDDPSTGRADTRCLPPVSADRFIVVLAHAPAVPLLTALTTRSPAVDLVLCGHSHGGQWRIPGLRPFWLPSGCGGGIRGASQHNGFTLYVNQGLGWTLLPVRINCRPEILVIDWVSEAAGGAGLGSPRV